MIKILENNENFEMVKSIMQPILVGYINCNGDTGFFAELKEDYFPLKGLKIESKLENINSKFCDVEYYLLESKKIVKFISWNIFDVFS